MAMAQIWKFLLLTIWNFLTLGTSLFEAILIKFLAVPKSGVNTCPPIFGQTCVPKNKLHDAFSKDDVNTSSAILHVLRTISIYRPLLVWTSWGKLGWKLLSFYNNPVIRFHRPKPSSEPYCSPFRQDFVDNQEWTSFNPYFVCIKVSLVAEMVSSNSALPMLARISIGYW